MEVEIIETRDFPSSELNRAGQMETHAFVRLDGAEVISLNLGRRVTDQVTLAALVKEQLKSRQSLRGQKFTL